MSAFKQPSPNRVNNLQPMRGTCLTPWLRAYEATLALAEIERLDKRLAAAFEADKGYQPEQARHTEVGGPSSQKIIRERA